MCFILFLIVFLLILNLSKVSAGSYYKDTDYNNYSDVLLLQNNLSSDSIEIGKYFADQRSVTHILNLSINLLGLSTPEDINFSYFNQTVLQPIKEYLVGNDPDKKLNYIVTTKGIPIRVLKNEQSPVWSSSVSGERSLDSLLTIAFDKYNYTLTPDLNNSPLNHDYYSTEETFSRADYGFFLVTRLDAYTVEQAKALVNKSKDAYTGKDAYFVVDEIAPPGLGSVEWGGQNGATENSVTSKGYNYYRNHTNNVFVANFSKVIGYGSWGDNDCVTPLCNQELNTYWNTGALLDNYRFENWTNATNPLNWTVENGTWYNTSIVNGFAAKANISGFNKICQNVTLIEDRDYYFGCNIPQSCNTLNYSNLVGVAGAWFEWYAYNSLDNLVGQNKSRIFNGTSDFKSIRSYGTNKNGWFRYDNITDATKLKVCFVANLSGNNQEVNLHRLSLIEIKPTMEWINGSIATLVVSTSARTLEKDKGVIDYSSNFEDNRQLRIGDMIEDGVTGIQGFVNEPTINAVAKPLILFDRYVRGYNLADSYYMSSQYLAWMDIVIGDPKTHINNLSTCGGAVACTCGSIIISDYTMTSDLNPCKLGLLAGEDNITLNCDGHRINGSGYDNGIDVIKKRNITISNCNISNFENGIYIKNSSNSSIINNTINRNVNGIQMFYGLNNSLRNNSAYNNEQIGIFLESNSSNNLLMYNIANSNLYGIYLYQSPNNNLISNNMSNNTYNFNINGDINEHFNNTLSTTNIVDYSYRIYYNYSISNYVFNSVSAPQAGVVICAKCNNVTYKDLNLSHKNVGGIYFFNTTNSTINNIISNSNTLGILLKYSPNNMINSSNFSSNDGDAYLISSSTNNTCLNCSYDISKEYVESGSQLIRKWYYKANVTASNGSSISGASVLAYNVSGALIQNLTTGADGLTPLGSLIEYVNNGGTRSDYNNYTINASHPTYGTTNSHSYNITIEQNILNDVFTLFVDTYRFYIKDSAGNNVAWLGNLGNIVLKGSCFSGVACNSQTNSFIIANSTSDHVAYINTSGDLCIEKGDCSDQSATCNPTRNAFIIQNSLGVNMSYIDFDGDLCLRGELQEKGTP